MDLAEDLGAEKGSDSTGEVANVLSSLEAANILASGGLKLVFTTASPTIATVSRTDQEGIGCLEASSPVHFPTASEELSTANVYTAEKDCHC
ncbi:hypothetical protein Tco_1151717 [Tanacetum coccineum]